MASVPTCGVISVHRGDSADGTTTIDLLDDFEVRYNAKREAETDNGQSTETGGE